jgi:hypothetical protein
MAINPRSLAKIASDKLYNARRRLFRQADSLERQAAKMETQKGASDALAGSYRTRAAELRSQAQSLYASNVTKGTGLKRGTEAYTRALEQATQEAVQREINPKTWRKREEMTIRSLSGEGGRKFYAATSDIWNRPGVVSYRQRNQAIMDYFGEDSMQGVLEKMRSGTGVDYMERDTELNEWERYEEAALRGKMYVATLR